MPTARLSGVDRVIVDRAVVDTTLQVLRKFGKYRLEGLVLWLGEIEPRKAHVTCAFTPDQQPVADEDGVGYFVGGDTLFELARNSAGRFPGLGKEYRISKGVGYAGSGKHPEHSIFTP